MAPDADQAQGSGKQSDSRRIKNTGLWIDIGGLGNRDGKTFISRSRRLAGQASMLKLQNPVLVILDMQRDFLDPGAPIEIARGREIVPNLVQLLSSCRKLRVPVVHVITIHRRDGKDWEILEPSRVPPHCIENTDGSKIISELAPLENEFVVVKKRYSAFFNTEFDAILRRLQAKTLIIAGVTTECCVRSTVFDAYFRDYHVIVPMDCTDSLTEAKKKSSLQDIVDCVGDAVPSSEVINAMGAQIGSE